MYIDRYVGLVGCLDDYSYYKVQMHKYIYSRVQCRDVVVGIDGGEWSKSTMASDGQSFCEKIRDVFEAWDKENAELVLADAVP